MKVLLLFLFSIISLTGYSQESTPKHQRKGTIVAEEYHTNGGLKEKGRKKLQVKLSSTTSGRMNGVMSYLKHGKWTEFYINGNKKRVVIYDKGEIVKEKREWNEDGSRKRRQ